MAFENNSSVENCSISVTPKALDFSGQVVPSTDSSAINSSTHRVTVINGSVLQYIYFRLNGTAKVSATANTVKGLNLTDELKERLQINSSKRKRCARNLRRYRR